MAEINVAPQQGPFSQELVPRQSDPMSANTGYQKPVAGILGMAGKFLEGMTRGRVMKYAQEQDKANRTFQVLGAHVQNYLNDPNVDPASKSEVSGKYFKILASSAMDQLGESTKGKNAKETPGGKLAHGAKSLLEAFTGGKLKPEKPDVGSITDLLASMEQGTRPGNQIQPQIDQATEQMRAAAKALGPNPTQEQLRQSEGFQKAVGRIQALAPDRADKLIKDFVEGYQKAPARGSKEAVVDAAMSADEGAGKPGTPPPSRSGQMPTVMRKDQPAQEPGVATGQEAGKISGKQMVIAKEMGLVGETQVRSYGGKPVRVFSVQPGPGLKGGTYSIDGKLMDGPGEEYKAPPPQFHFSTTDKNGQTHFYIGDPVTSTAKPINGPDGKPLVGEKAATSKTVWKTDQKGNRVLQVYDSNSQSWSPAKDKQGNDIVSYDSQSKEWQRQHAQVRTEVVAEYDKYVKQDAALDKEAAASVRSIDNAKDAAGNPLPDAEKQKRKDAMWQDITRRKKQNKSQTEYMIQGITASVGLPGRAFASEDQAEDLDRIDNDIDSARPWSDSDIQSVRVQ